MTEKEQKKYEIKLELIQINKLIIIYNSIIYIKYFVYTFAQLLRQTTSTTVKNNI